MTDSSTPSGRAPANLWDPLPERDTAVTARHDDPSGMPPAVPATSAPPPSEDHRTRSSARADAPSRPRRRLWSRVGVALLVLLLLVATAAAVHLFRTTHAWQDRSETYLDAANGLGEDLALTRAELAGTEAELEAVRTQLGEAQDRILELADEKAQIGDDREAQRQLVDYQERVNDAAGRVALALDQCVQGQQQLIGYMENADAYDPGDLERFGQEVESLCQAATEANISLQRELDR